LRPHTSTLFPYTTLFRSLANVFETTVILKHLAGEAISVITALSSSQKNTGLVALKDRGILNPKDLKGRTIGISKNRNGDFLLFRSEEHTSELQSLAYLVC